MCFQLVTTLSTWSWTGSLLIEEKTKEHFPLMLTSENFRNTKLYLPGHQVRNFPFHQVRNILFFRQLQCLWFWNQTEQVPGPLHPLHLLALRHVCHDVLGILLCSSGKRIHNDNKVIYLFNLFIFFSHSFNSAKFNLIPYCICCSYSHFVNFKKFLTNLHSKNSILKTQ